MILMMMMMVVLILLIMIFSYDNDYMVITTHAWVMATYYYDKLLFIITL